jgi:hypothetical protein
MPPRVVETSLTRDQEKSQVSSSVDRGIATHLDQRPEDQVIPILIQKADDMKTRGDGKIQETSHTYDAAKRKIENSIIGRGISI